MLEKSYSGVCEKEKAFLTLAPRGSARMLIVFAPCSRQFGTPKPQITSTEIVEPLPAPKLVEKGRTSLFLLCCPIPRFPTAPTNKTGCGCQMTKKFVLEHDKVRGRVLKRGE